MIGTRTISNDQRHDGSHSSQVSGSLEKDRSLTAIAMLNARVFAKLYYWDVIKHSQVKGKAPETKHF